MPNSRNSESTEMYLETILKESLLHPDVHAIHIASAMGFSKPSVSVAMKNLREQGYITVDEESHIHLTESGLAIANSVYERHQVLTRLFEGLGVSPETAEQDACRIEHCISEETFAAIKKHAKNYGVL